MLNRLFALLTRWQSKRLGDTSDEFPIHNGVHAHAMPSISSATDVTWQCPHCDQRIVENAFDAHLIDCRQAVWTEFIATLEFAPIDEHATKPFPPIDDEVTHS